MKVFAVTLALIIGTVGVVFLGILTWDALSEEEVTTDWLGYQACVETVTLEAMHEDEFFDQVFSDDRSEATLGDMFMSDPVMLDLILLGAEAGATEVCSELRPPLTTDE